MLRIIFIILIALAVIIGLMKLTGNDAAIDEAVDAAEVLATDAGDVFGDATETTVDAVGDAVDATDDAMDADGNVVQDTIINGADVTGSADSVSDMNDGTAADAVSDVVEDDIVDLDHNDQTAYQPDPIQEALDKQKRPAISTIEINQRMRFGRRYEATLIVDRDLSGRPTMDITINTDQPIVSEIPIEATSDLMANAVSADFDIRAVTPKWQSFTIEEPAIWTWVIEPRQPGRSTITFSLLQKVKIDDEEKIINVDRYPQRIEVIVGFWANLKIFFVTIWRIIGPILGVLATIGGAVAFILLLAKDWREKVISFIQNRGKRKPTQTPSTDSDDV